ncbi:MAG: hypothetical protein LQ343_002999 [Gyalolechia ehrenbergii]|nr:MAG: hypothetical protein LQ343_002999 [Gyalolechia ehrenbergii]
MSSKRPSPLAISTASVQRLLKEETTYRTELASQEQRLRELEQGGGEDDDGNREWTVRQEKQAIEETKAVFEPLREKLSAAAENLEQSLVSGIVVIFQKGTWVADGEFRDQGDQSNLRKGKWRGRRY